MRPRHLFILPIIAGLLVAKAIPVGAEGPPAPYKVPPAGTLLDYGGWRCVVGGIEGYTHTCRQDEQRARLFARFIPVGVPDKEWYAGSIPMVSCPSYSGARSTGRDLVVPRLAVKGDPAAAAASLWPLKVGRKARIELIDGRAQRRASYEFVVEDTETMTWNGESREVYRVAARVVYFCDGFFDSGFQAEENAEIEETWWYDPRAGLVLRHERYWRQWGSKDTAILNWVRYPERPAIAAVAPPTIRKTPAPLPPPTIAKSRRAPRPAPRPVSRDDSPPVIEAPATLAVNGPIVELAGRVRDDSRIVELSIDGRALALDPDGSFTVKRGVAEGSTALALLAVDEWGNQARHIVTVTRRPTARPYAGIEFGAYHALVIGNNDYRNLIALKTAVNDATDVARILERDYGFAVTLLTDASRGDILRALSRFRARLNFDDNLLIYYAGHGLLDEIGEQGYWLPVDAEEDVPTNWISTGDVTVMLRALRAKHVMVVADSCYSGTLVRASGARPKTATQGRSWIKRMLSKRTRVALVSGGLEPVADDGGDGRHSVFATAFIDALEGNHGVMEGQSLFDRLKRPVVLNADQTPQYSDIRKAGHDGGDFLFVRRN